MKAAVLDEFDADLRIDDIPVPELADDELLVRVRAVGLCGTDLKIAGGAIPGLRLPLVLGHEVAGEVVDGGAGLPAGQRVAVYVIESCGECPACLRGDAEICYRAIRIGFERDGGLAEYIAVKARNLLPFSDDVSFEHAAVAMDAVLTPWRALRERARVKAGDSVLVMGAGGLGLNAVQLAVAAGGRVAVVEPLESHRSAALEAGADLAVSPDDAAAELDRWTDDGVDVALEVSGQPAAFRLAVESLRPGGLVVCAGYRPGVDYAADSGRIALAQIRIEGNRGGNVDHARAALAAVERGEVRPLIDRTGPLEEVNEFLGLLRAGEILGRVVIQM